MNVAVFSRNATGIDFCLFDDSGTREVERIALPEETEGVFHAFLPGIAVGRRYGLRAHGPWALAEGHRFNPAKLLVDPYARALDRAFTLHPAMQGQSADGRADPSDSARYVPKGIVSPLLEPWDPKRPATSWQDTVVYEMHVRGFTKQHPDVPLELRGTMAGLAHPAALEHLVRLGITAVELMPMAAAIDEAHLAAHGLTNYWGYNTIGWMVPDPGLAPGGIAEVRRGVEALHEAGIEVLLDVVLNHSGEGEGAFGPQVSLRGLDNATYYRLVPGDPSRDVNDTGTGNTLALDRPPVTALAVDTLRYWAEAAGVDGFRYDLATTLGRRAEGFDARAPLLEAIQLDPVLRTLKHIAEPWDIGPGGYRLGEFPASFAEWNDRYRDRVRQFWRGDGDHLGDFATRISGSEDLFGPRKRPPSRSINFVTAHDGFTLRDLVSYEQKHNEANGEGNRDGTSSNHSWNHGVEGETTDAGIIERRKADVRALLATLLFSRGTPMLLMGDELGRTQAGNNNGYAQDSPLTWVDWENADQGMISYTSRLIALRRSIRALHEDRWLTGTARRSGGLQDVRWLRVDGQEITSEDWSSGRERTLVAEFGGPADDRVLLAVHGGVEERWLRPPAPRTGRHWRRLVDSSADPSAAVEVILAGDTSLRLSPRSLSLLVEARVGTESASASPRPHHTSSGGAEGRPPSPMTFPRTAGILLHPTSLPGPSGIGDLGPEAHRFIEFLHAAGLKIWQVLPIGPTGYGDSPYQCFSAFAGNPMLVHVPGTEGSFDDRQVDWSRVIPVKQAALRRFTSAMRPDDAYRIFAQEQGWWLEDYALFMALKEAHGGVEWTRWEEGARDRDPLALGRWRTRLAKEIEHHRRIQHLFFQQWGSIREHCREKGIQVMGDLPIYVAHDSADVWAARHYFVLREDGRPSVQAGVPPDYFSSTGQLWGNPIYDWEAMQRDGFAWWIRRMRSLFSHFDVVRIDHFRGFEAYWEVPGDATTAIEGRWVKAPGDALFSAITRALGPLPIVAENLGLITPEVEELRDRYGYPGMSILQFAFDSDGGPNDFQPHRYPRERVVYTGTHDNDTAVGWWNSEPGGDSTRTQEMIDAEKAFARRYLGTEGDEIHWVMIRAVLASVANTALFPIQDVLGLGSEARMNLPGRQSGNWGFRFTWDQVETDTIRRLRDLVDLYER